MLGTTEPTQYDLRFEFLGIPVRVSVWFWLMAAVLGGNALKEGLSFLLAWMIVVFVSILVHEYGHALLAKAYGYRPRILLYQFGGLAMFEPYGNFTRTKSILISFAGPFAGFVLFGLTVAFQLSIFPGIQARLDGRTLWLAEDVVRQLIYVNLFWGLMNLLPVLPLDGGRICQDVCSWFSPRRGQLYAMQTGAFVAACVAIFALSRDDYYIALLFGMLCVQNLQMMGVRF